MNACCKITQGFSFKEKKNLFQDFEANTVPGKSGEQWRKKSVFTDLDQGPH